MADIAGPYSSLKILHHPERIAQLKRGEQIVPTQIECVLSDFCTHDCIFCLVSDTLVKTPVGNRKVEDLEVGDEVITPLGGKATVTKVSKRLADSLVTFSAAGRTLRCTPEHPILTQDGYKPASELTLLDSVAVQFEITSEPCLLLRKITDLQRESLMESVWVHNFSCEPFEAYIANGMAVHNCAYRWSGYSSNQLFTEGAQLAQFGTNNPIRTMPTEKALELIDDCVEMGIPAIQYTGGGEITAHPQHVEIMKYALDKGMDVALVSHGEIFREGHIENLLRCKWVRFSLDSATPETYGMIRRINPKRMERTLANIRKLVEARKQYIADGNPCDLVIGIGFVVTKENWKEVLLGAQLAKSLGADNIRISAVFQPDDTAYFDGFHDEAAALCKEAELLGDASFRIFNNFGERYQDLADKSPEHPFCGYQHFTNFVGATMDSFRCCVLAYNERGRIGSMKDQRFKEMWESEQKKEAFETFDATKCTHCMFLGKLRTINYAIDPKPTHANFV